MRRLIISIFMAAAMAISCNKATQEGPETNTDGDSIFRIEILDMHSSHCKIRVTPADKTSPYFCGVATEEYLSTFGPLDDMHTTATNFIETYILENGDMKISDMMKTGVYERDVTGLQPGQKFVVFACHTDETGAIISEIGTVRAVTPEISASGNEFEIEIDQITATSAMLFITPSTDDDYVWLEFPEFIYKDMTLEELEDFLLKNYKPFFGMHTHSGEMVHSFDDKLDPDTEYMIIVFGYDGGLTTPLTTKIFRTLKPGDPSDVTFRFEYGTITARSASVTFRPSDPSVSYLAIVADEELLARNGGADADGVKKLIDEQIKQAIASGDCEDRAEFAGYYAQRGVKTGSFSLKPGLKHYSCAVCVDEAGNYASEVAIDEFEAPAEESTDASVTVSLLKYFDGDALTEFYPEYAGWAVARFSFVLGGSASDAIYTVYPTEILEEEKPTEEEIRAVLLDPELLGTYTFSADALSDILLEWDYGYRLYAVPLDSDDNAGKMFSLDIPALSKEDASPADEF